jgi:DnaJ like chaperone protein
MSWTGKIVGAILGYLLLRGFWGAVIGALLGHFFDQAVFGKGGRARAPLSEVREKFFAATFAVMGHVAKSDGRVSEAEIAAARQIMAELGLSGEQIHTAIGHFSRGKNADFDLEGTVRGFADSCAQEPNLLRVFLEFQVRAALEGVDMQGPARGTIQRIADYLDISLLELARIEAILRIRREQYRQRSSGPGGRGGAGQPPPKAGMQLSAAYQILEVDAKATNDEVSKAYRRQLSKHHPDKLKSNGLPESMLEHAKQRTQQIIEAYDLVKAARGMS